MFDFVKEEEKILKFWQKNNIFAKTLKKKSPKGDFVFYDGPPFATGLPHYGHLVASLIKDVVPRYQTMKGFRVNRRWGWDCHGLPVEVLVEQELGIKSKKDIEKMGIEKFNEACQQSVLRYVDEWKKIIPRFGRWVDMENDYKTMETWYMESIWWVFKQLWDKGLIYQDYRSVPYCPHCETPLSNFEVNQGYRDNVEDPSVYLRFKIKNQEKTSFLVWTTTPWTLPGNTALAIRGDIDYVKIKINGEFLILAQAALERLKLKGKIIKHYFGKNLLGLEYEPLFNFVKPDKRAYYVLDGKNLVSVEEGTGIVHLAPAYGEEDFKLGKENNLPLVVTIESSGKMMPFTPWPGIFVKKADPLIIENLKERGLLFKEEKIRHTYPFCWRCGSPIYDYLWPSWFVKVTKFKDSLIKNNQKINWLPSYIKQGRFGKWLEGARDWNISRNRYWGTPIPVWICKKCKKQIAIGSLKELQAKSGLLPNNNQGEVNLHRPYVDEIKIKCPDCQGEMVRTSEVFDCWFESGSMPYAHIHYPFEHKKWFEKNFPAQFIAEGLDQTRGWFYTLLVLSTALFNQSAYLNVIVNGLVLSENGQKMSKRLKNYPEPMEIINKYGADSLRYYLLTSPVMKAEDLCFSEKGVVETFKKVIMTLENVYAFYNLYIEKKDKIKQIKSINILDRWVLSRLNLLIKKITQAMDNYDLMSAAKPIGEFINELSTWYLRRSRTRFREKGEEKKRALQTLNYVLLILSQLMAPFLPFLAEKLYQQIKGDKESVHLEDWPKADKKLIDKKLEAEMEMVRKICELGHSLRKRASIKVRQPLGKLKIKSQKLKIEENLLDLIKDELNIKEIELTEAIEERENWLKIKEDEIEVSLKTEITPELKIEGMLREIARQISGLRKEARLTINDSVAVYFKTESKELKNMIEKFEKELKEKTASKSVTEGEPAKILIKKQFEINNEKIDLSLCK